ncbi:MAG: TadE/TadG family type IV pilus assembly protein, partial [Nocardioidaceae bacterium]
MRPQVSPRDERGAVVLEFALIAPIILMILFGVLTWGLWLNDALNLRQGVREASRQGVVNVFGSTDSCGATYDITPSEDIKKLVCSTKESGKGLTGETYVKVLLPGHWVRGQS